MSKNELKELIQARIRRNGVQAITGEVLQEVLLAIVDELTDAEHFVNARGITNAGSGTGALWIEARTGDIYGTAEQGVRLEAGLGDIVFKISDPMFGVFVEDENGNRTRLG